jgi:valyl-tRNA synthetase
MVMTGMKFIGKKPFDDVVVTGTVLDKNGQRMSKTKGNGVDPLEVFDKYGVDATRMTLAGSATGMDFAWRDEKVESYRNFANKIWNATRFCLMNADGAAVDHNGLLAGDLDLADRWIISRLNRTALDVNRALERYEFHTAVSLLYHFFWDDFCDWYIELVKDAISSASADGVVLSARRRIVTILEIALRMLHPFMPYLTEELWLKLPGVSGNLHHAAYAGAEPSIMLTSFPPGDASAIDETAEADMGAVIDTIKKVRNIRAEMNIAPSILFTVHIAADAAFQDVFRANEARILKLARAERLVIGETLDIPKASAKAVTANASIAIPLEGLIDFDKERERLSNQIAKLTEEKARLDAQLANQNFLERAPAEKVEALRERNSELEAQIATLQNNLISLSE